MKRLECRAAGGECSDQGVVHRFWRKVWKADLAPRMKMTTWRLYHNSLPDAANLRRRGCLVEEECQFCGYKIKTTIHLFRDCWWGRAVGERIGIIREAYCEQGRTPAEWLHYCEERASREQFTLIMRYIWVIWKSRNDRRFQSKIWSVEETADRVTITGRESRLMSLVEIRRGDNEHERQEEYLFYCDGSWKSRDKRIGWAVVVMKGAWVESVSAGWLEGEFSITEAEGVAMSRGMEVAEEMGLDEVIFISDSITVIWSLTSGGVALERRGNWFQECLRKIENNSRWKLGHVLREENSIADKLCGRARRCRWSWARKDAIPKICA